MAVHTVVYIRRIARRLWRITLPVALGYVLAVGTLGFFQERLLFPSQRMPLSQPLTTALAHDTLSIVADDGVQLHAIRIRHAGPVARGVAIFFHGNGGTVDDWVFAAVPYQSLGLDVVLYDYRGYGRSGGQITNEGAFHSDARKVYSFVADAYRGQRIVLIGRSLGSGIAARLAADVKPALLLLETPYTSLRAVVENRAPWVPVRWLLKYEFDTTSIAARINCPVAIVHGDQDELVPFSHGRQLASAIKGPTRFFAVRGGGHNTFFGMPDHRDAIAQIGRMIESLP
jgi:uncharacterized protein